MSSQLLQLSTTGSFQCLSVTEAVRRFLRSHGEQDGAVVIASRHTTTAVVVPSANSMAHYGHASNQCACNLPSRLVNRQTRR